MTISTSKATVEDLAQENDLRHNLSCVMARLLCEAHEYDSDEPMNAEQVLFAQQFIKYNIDDFECMVSDWIVDRLVNNA